MINLYLKADSESALIEALPFARHENAWLEASNTFALDIIGILYEDTSEWPLNERGELLQEPAQLPGFYANLKVTEEIITLVPSDIIISAPTRPRRVWA